MTDDGEDISAVFTRLCEVNIQAGDVPDDGSGVDCVLTRTIEARDRDRDWNVALNGNTETEQTVTDFPDDGDETTVPAARAVIYLGCWPVGVLGPYGGQLACEEDGVEIHPLEDEILRDLETQLLDMGADVDRTIPDVATDGGGELDDRPDPDRMGANLIREEANALRDRVDWFAVGEDVNHHLRDRLSTLHAAIRERVSFDPPECPGCENPSYAQVTGDPVECTNCGHEARAELESDVHDYWERLYERTDVDGGDDR